MKERKRLLRQWNIWHLEEKCGLTPSISFWMDALGSDAVNHIKRRLKEIEVRFWTLVCIVWTFLVLCAWGTWIGWAAATTNMSQPQGQGAAAVVGGFFSSAALIGAAWPLRSAAKK